MSLGLVPTQLINLPHLRSAVAQKGQGSWHPGSCKSSARTGYGQGLPGPSMRPSSVRQAGQLPCISCSLVYTTREGLGPPAAGSVYPLRSEHHCFFPVTGYTVDLQSVDKYSNVCGGFSLCEPGREGRVPALRAGQLQCQSHSCLTLEVAAHFISLSSFQVGIWSSSWAMI